MEHRALREDELERWFEHVDEVFVRTPRAYFERHWHNDPWHALDGIRVTVDTENDNRIASSLRVFVRRALIGGQALSCGGIGEVSTKEDYRKRGLATTLLHDAIEWMRNKDMVFSILHTRSAAPLYKSLGWCSIPLYSSVIQVPITAIQNHSSGFQCRPLDVYDTAQLQCVAAIHRTYARHFNGTFLRDEPEYWSKWIAYEFTRENAYSAVVNSQTDASLIVGYASCFVRHAESSQVNGVKAIEVRLREFGTTDTEMAKDGGQSVLLSAVQHMIGQFSQLGGASEAKMVSVTFPAAIENYFITDTLSALASPPSEASVSQDVDHGTMIRLLNAPGKEPEFEETLRRRPGGSTFATTRDARTDIQGGYFLFWETDSF